MEDFYKDGRDFGSGRRVCSSHDSPESDSDRYDFRRGQEEGQISREMEQE